LYATPGAQSGAAAHCAALTLDWLDWVCDSSLLEPQATAIAPSKATRVGRIVFEFMPRSADGARARLRKMRGSRVI
jgi:hypothetical protein